MADPESVIYEIINRCKFYYDEEISVFEVLLEKTITPNSFYKAQSLSGVFRGSHFQYNMSVDIYHLLFELSIQKSFQNTQRDRKKKYSG